MHQSSVFSPSPWVRRLLPFPVLAFAMSLFAQDSPSQGSYDDRLEKAVSLYSEKKYEEASALFESLTRSQPARKEGFLWLGKSERQLRHWSKARDAFNAFIKLAPKDVEGYRETARAWEQEGRTAEAMASYKQALEIEPGDAEIKSALDRLSGAPAPATPSAAPENSPAKEKDEGFWHVGLAGVCKARTVWWGRALAVLVYVLGLMQAPALMKTYAMQMPAEAKDAAGCVMFFSGGMGAAFGYIVMWGIPTDWSWAFFVVCVLFVAGAGGAASKSLN